MKKEIEKITFEILKTIIILPILILLSPLIIIVAFDNSTNWNEFKEEIKRIL